MPRKLRRPIVYEWKPGPKRRVYMARCPQCEHWLAQTTVSNMRDPIIYKRDPVFISEKTEEITS